MGIRRKVPAILGWVGGIALVLGVLFGFNFVVDKLSSKKPSPEMEEGMKILEIQEKAWESKDNEIAALLSKKYEVQLNAVIEMYDSYMLKHRYLYNRISSNESTYKETGNQRSTKFDESFDYERTLANLSEKYQVSLKTIASIIVDYKILDLLSNVDANY